MIRFEHVSLRYGNQTILNDLNFEIKEGQFAVLIGPSGCGKTTTLKMINRLIQPDSGHIYLGGQDVAKTDRYQLRRRIGYVIQQVGLFPNMTVAQNICVVPRLLGAPREGYDDLVRRMLDMVGLPYESYAHKYPSELSGGQQQRIGILRALAASPPVVLMDEPFSALDPMTRRSLQLEIKRLQQKLNKTIVFVTHDMDEALDLADLIVFLDRGNIVQAAAPEEMLEHPATQQVRDFLGSHVSGPSPADLTAAGIEALTQMEHAGMVLDVSHLNDECFDEVVAHATRPFVASHSNSRAVCGVKRNLTDDQFRTIRDMGGIVGLNYCSEFLSNDATDKTAADVTFDQLAAHIEHWLDLGGEDVIALGGDWDGATVPAFLSDAGMMPEFQNMLSKHFGKTVMQKLCSDNALAFFERY